MDSLGIQGFYPNSIPCENKVKRAIGLISLCIMNT